MRYLVTIDGVEREIDVQITDDDTVSVSRDGVALDVDAVRVPGGVSLRIEGRVYDVIVGGPASGRQVAAGQRRAIAGVENERSRARRERRGGSAANDDEIRAPMPGRVVKILVAAGDEVEADQPLIVVEAMKMENSLGAPRSGTVTEIFAEPGQTVFVGDPLVQIQ